ncbi:MAG: HIT domain-containing protein [Chloroflexota bacterium]|nr:HIT domain-containing protein [Chloroflexota bacterium]
MERLWTPWRRAFVEAAAGESADQGCFLCAAATSSDDPGHLVLRRAARTYVLMNRYPYNTGHLLVAPYAHEGDLAALDGTVAADLMHTVQQCVAVLAGEYRPHAFNIGMNLGRPAGAGLPDHLHVHIVPRWQGDTNFMPVLGDTKVLPESLDQTYERLEPRFRT